MNPDFTGRRRGLKAPHRLCEDCGRFWGVEALNEYPKCRVLPKQPEVWLQPVENSLVWQIAFLEVRIAIWVALLLAD